MKNRPWIDWLAAAALLASVTAVAFAWLPGSPRLDRTVHESVGKALAQEALKLGGADGGITVIVRDTEAFPQPAADLALASFSREMRQAGVSIKSILRLQEDPLRPVQVPPGDFFELIRRGKAGEVIVSFMGPPLLLEEQRASLGPIQPKIVAFCPGPLTEQVNLRLLAEQNQLQAAVVSRPSKSLVRGQESFADLYQTLGAGALVPPSGNAGLP